jgi:hypothetical protein
MIFLMTAMLARRSFPSRSVRLQAIARRFVALLLTFGALTETITGASFPATAA